MRGQTFKNVACLMLEENFDKLILKLQDFPKPFTFVIQNAIKDTEEVKALLEILRRDSDNKYMRVWSPDTSLSITEFYDNYLVGEISSTIIVIGGGSLIDKVKTSINCSNRYVRFVTIPTRITDAAVTDISTSNLPGNTYSLPRLRFPIDLCYVNRSFLQKYSIKDLIPALYDAFSHVWEYINSQDTYNTNHDESCYMPDAHNNANYIIETLKLRITFISSYRGNPTILSDDLNYIFRICPNYYQNGYIGLPHIYADALVKLTGTKALHGRLIAYGLLLWSSLYPLDSYDSDTFHGTTVIESSKPKLSKSQIDQLAKIMSKNPCINNIHIDYEFIKAYLEMEVTNYD